MAFGPKGKKGGRGEREGGKRGKLNLAAKMVGILILAVLFPSRGKGEEGGGGRGKEVDSAFSRLSIVPSRALNFSPVKRKKGKKKKERGREAVRLAGWPGAAATISL